MTKKNAVIVDKAIAELDEKGFRLIYEYGTAAGHDTIAFLWLAKWNIRYIAQVQKKGDWYLYRKEGV